METLKVGMYCRTINGIQKFIKETSDVYAFDKGVIIKPDNIEKYIIKASHNIIDLIEVGDVVKYRELTFNNINNFSGEYVNDIHDEEMLNNIKIEIESEHIKLLEILTKEQFENNCYKIKGDE